MEKIFVKNVLQSIRNNCFVLFHPKNKKNQSNVFICDIVFHNNLQYIITIIQLNEKGNYKVFQFNKIENTYSELTVSKINFQTLNESIHKYNFHLDLFSVLQELDIVNLSPTILVNMKTLNHLIDHIDISKFNISSNNDKICKISCNFYTISLLDSYIDIDEVYI